MVYTRLPAPLQSLTPRAVMGMMTSLRQICCHPDLITIGSGADQLDKMGEDGVSRPEALGRAMLAWGNEPVEEIRQKVRTPAFSHKRHS
jgi:hypothetical protein